MTKGTKVHADPDERSRVSEGGFGAAETGLVSSAITAPVEIPGDVSSLVSQLFAFPSSDLVGVAASAFPSDVRRVDDYQFSSVGFVAGASREVRLMAEGGWPRLEIGPGMLRFGRFDTNRAERQRERVREAREKATREMIAADRRERHEQLHGPSPEGNGMHWAQRGYMDETSGPEPVEGISRGGITSWSAKSRANMIATVSSLDLEPVVRSGFPAMVTLTMPGDWLSLAPSAVAANAMVLRWKEAYRKMWGAPVGIWKREFQRRGAPHWHIWTVPPIHRPGCSGVMTRCSVRTRKATCDLGCDFRTWLRYSWAHAMRIPRFDDLGQPLEWNHSSLATDTDDGEHCSCSEWCRSINAGTNVDRAEGLKASDPRRLAVYFLKESLGGEGKAYQNGAPLEWASEAWSDVDTRQEHRVYGSVGRFWGVWGIAKAIETVPIDPAHQYALWRVLRRVRDGNGGVRTRTVQRVNTKTGVIKNRRVNRRSKTRAAAGWLAVNDGASFGVRLGEFMTTLQDDRAARGAWLASMPRYAERLERERAAARSVGLAGIPDADSGFWGERAVKPRNVGSAGRVWMP